MAIPLRNILLLLIAFILSASLLGQDYKAYIHKNFSKLSNKQLVDTLINLSEQLAEENPDTALYLGNVALHLGVAGKENRTIALAARRIADAYFYRNEYINAIAYYQKSADADLLLQADTSTFYAERLSDAAYCYQELGIYEKALEIFRIALRIQSRLDNKVEIGNNLSNIGSNHFFRAEYDKAIEYYSLTLKLDRKSGDSSSIAISLNNIGMVYSRWGKHKESMKFYTEALAYTTSEISRSIRLSNIGMTWYHLNDYDKALKFLYEALNLDIRNNQQIKIAVRKNEIGNILAAKKDYTKAVQLHEEALKIFRSAEIKESEVITLADIADIYRKTKQFSKAESCYIESANLARSIKSLYYLSRNYKGLSGLAEEKGDFRQAFEYFKLYTQTKDSIFNTENHEQLARFEILFETEKKEKENQLLLRDNELKEKNQRFGIAIITALIVVLLLIVFLYRVKSKNLQQSQLLFAKEQEIAKIEIDKKVAENRSLEDRIFAEQQINRLEKEKHIAEIEHKNTELANSTICLVNKNEILGEIKEKLKTHQNFESIHEVVQFINANTDIDQDWNKFRITFEDVHPGFFDRLVTKFPQLTDHDIRLASYLRISLSSREIAGLMNVSLEATNKGRQRLRKKLELQPEADLTEFLRIV